jgi:hypothetical protein
MAGSSIEFISYMDFGATYKEALRNEVEVKVKVKVTLRPIISRSVRPGVRRPSGTRDQFYHLLEILLKRVTVRYVVAPSDERTGL